MKVWCIVLWVWLGCVFAGAVNAAESEALRPSKPEVRQALAAAIEGQLGAIREGAWERAYGYAARPLRARLTVEAFAVMVLRGYPQIARHESAKVGLARDAEGRALVSVVLRTDGREVVLLYSLVREPEGWRIAGVAEHRPEATL